MSDRTYVSAGKAWHAFSTWTRAMGITKTACGRRIDPTAASDRVPSTGHLCGNCARVIASSTDIETPLVGTSDEITEGVGIPVAPV